MLAQTRGAAGGAAPCCSGRGLLRCGGPQQAARARQRLRPVAATSVASQPAAAAVESPSVAHRVLPAPKDATFEDNTTCFVEEFRIRGNEAGPDQRANIITIANLLQECGGNHGVAMWGRSSSGFAAMPGMDHLIFVATRMQIRMEAYPSWGDLVRLETYFAEDGRLATRRDWRISDAVTGQHLGAATSTWVTINTETRKLAKLPEDVKRRFLRLAPSPPRSAIPANETRLKLPDFEWPPQLAAPPQLGRRSDMDPNGHINNVAYLAWAMEVIPDHVFNNYQLCEVEMDFKAECTAGDQIECFGMPLTDCANGNGSKQQFLHLLRKGGSDVEVWRARTTWKPQQAGVPVSLAAAAAASSSSSSGSSGSAAAPSRNGAAPQAKQQQPQQQPPSQQPVPQRDTQVVVRVNGQVVACANSNGSVSTGAGASTGAGVPSSKHSNSGTASCTVTDCRNTSCSNNSSEGSK